MKILDRYILTTYLKTFLSVFIILMLIFVLQAIWLYISELAGKDLDIDVVFKFLLYVTPTLIPLILPLYKLYLKGKRIIKNIIIKPSIYLKFIQK